MSFQSELVKSIGSRSEHRQWIQKRMQELTYWFAEWYAERNFLDAQYNSEFEIDVLRYGKEKTDLLLSKKYAESLNSISGKYLQVCKLLTELWFLLKYYIKEPESKFNLDSFDIKIKGLSKLDTQPQTVEDIYNDIDKLFAKYIPIHDEQDRGRGDKGW